MATQTAQTLATAPLRQCAFTARGSLSRDAFCADVAFIDRADLKLHIGLPSLAARSLPYLRVSPSGVRLCGRAGCTAGWQVPSALRLKLLLIVHSLVVQPVARFWGGSGYPKW